MVMSKKEQEMLDNAILLAETTMALRWTPVIKPDVPIPSQDEVATGWLYTISNRKIYEIWSHSTIHGDMPYMPKFYRSGGKASYSTKALAYAAMRNELERKFAIELLEIDKFIANY
ncbi:hypothetical protein BCS42_11575 [Crenothrix sp. D3]|nr:hypothetical protein BCS42_11575 [Crenothrix sp. D3]